MAAEDRQASILAMIEATAAVEQCLESVNQAANYNLSTILHDGPNSTGKAFGCTTDSHFLGHDSQLVQQGSLERCIAAPDSLNDLLRRIAQPLTPAEQEQIYQELNRLRIVIGELKAIVLDTRERMCALVDPVQAQHLCAS